MAQSYSSVPRAKVVPPLPGRHVEISASIANVKGPPRLPYFNVQSALAVLQRTVDKTATTSLAVASWSPYEMQTMRRRINSDSEDQMTTLVVIRTRQTSKLIGSQDCPIRVVAGVIMVIPSRARRLSQSATRNAT